MTGYLGERRSEMSWKYGKRARQAMPQEERARRVLPAIQRGWPIATDAARTRFNVTVAAGCDRIEPKQKMPEPLALRPV
jgi:hypothetical protein